MSTTKYSVLDHESAARPETMAHPQWLDEQLYPFQSRFVEVDGNRIHYIDEGSGPILFFVATAIRAWWDEEIEP